MRLLMYFLRCFFHRPICEHIRGCQGPQTNYKEFQTDTIIEKIIKQNIKR